MSPNSTAEKPSDIGTLPLNLTGVLMFILLEAALETYYIVLWTFFFFFPPPTELFRAWIVEEQK